MASEAEQEKKLLEKRLKELAEKSYQQNVYTYTSFLGMSGLDTFYQMERELAYAGYQVFGGMEETERAIIRFGNVTEFGYDEEFPITCLRISPLMKKFADELGHRDFLGSLMNLGIERDVLGDILIHDKEAYLFCMDSIAEYIVESLDKVKHTNVKCEKTEQIPSILKKEPVRKDVTVSSERIDGVISKIYNISRNASLSLFSAKKICVNGRIVENNSGILKPEDVVTVRGFGKFVYYGMNRETRKGKLSITVGIYQ